LHGVIVTLDDLKQVESIIRDYVAASPAPDYDYQSDGREVEVEAGTAILPNVDFARALKPEELSKLDIRGKTNNIAWLSVHFTVGGDVDLIWHSGDEKCVAAADLIVNFLRERPARMTKSQMSELALALTFAPLVVSLADLYLISVRLAPVWLSLSIPLLAIPLWVASSQVRKRVSSPTIRNRTMQELEDARRIPRAQLIAYLLTIVSITVTIAIALTR
jgi:hypothetical protein